MEKTLLTLDITNVVTLGIVLLFWLFVFALVIQYGTKLWGGAAPANNSGSF